MSFINQIQGFLSENRIDYDTESINGISVVIAHTPQNIQVAVIPVQIISSTPQEAEDHSRSVESCIEKIVERTGERPYIIAQDRWRCQEEMMKARLLAHLGIFTQIYARNCEVRRIDKATAADFLRCNHSYGDAACRYRYGLFLKRHTGHNSGSTEIIPGTLVAVATFSNARKWVKGEKTIRSYEWTRYASLPELRISGGMGKLLKAFIEEVNPDDIMTYADLEWSEGKVYEALGFSLEGHRPGGIYFLMSASSKRIILSDKPCIGVDMPPPARGCLSGAMAGVNGNTGLPDNVYFKNWGSNKYRLKLTDYQ